MTGYPDTSAEETVVYAFDLEDAWDLSEHLMWYHTFTVTQWDTWEEQGVLDAWYFPGSIRSADFGKRSG